MNPPISYAVQGMVGDLPVTEKTSPKFCRAFALGCKGEAIPVTRESSLRPGDVAFFGSPEIWSNIIQPAWKDPSRNVYFGDHAYFRRHEYFKVTRNRLQHDGVPIKGYRYDPDRLRKVYVREIHPWRRGSAVVICPNSPTYMRLFGIDAKQWINEVVATLQQHTDRPLIVRWKTTAATRPLYVDLHDAWTVVVFSSNSAVEGLIHGVPCITLADFAASRRMGRHRVEDIETPFYPDDREQFLTVLAHNQWTLKEMEDGLAWKALRHVH